LIFDDHSPQDFSVFDNQVKSIPAKSLWNLSSTFCARLKSAFAFSMSGLPENRFSKTSVPLSAAFS
jgi:hypothetical protein